MQRLFLELAMYMARTNDRAETKVKEKEKTRKKNRQNNTIGFNCNRDIITLMDCL